LGARGVAFLLKLPSAAPARYVRLRRGTCACAAVPAPAPLHLYWCRGTCACAAAPLLVPRYLRLRRCTFTGAAVRAPAPLHLYWCRGTCACAAAPLLVPRCVRLRRRTFIGAVEYLLELTHIYRCYRLFKSNRVNFTGASKYLLLVPAYICRYRCTFIVDIKQRMIVQISLLKVFFPRSAKSENPNFCFGETFFSKGT
jgi:hypothetical protein